MANLNKVFLIGRLTKDPELRYLPNGTPKAELRLATSREYKGRDGQMQKDTCYVDVVVWSRQAETCSQYLAKGRQIHVEGRLDYQEWEDKNTGGKRSKHQIVADHVQFLDGRGQGGGGAQGADENMGADDESMAGAGNAQPSFQGGGGNAGGGNFGGGQGGGRSYGNGRGGNGGGGWSRGNAGGAQTYGARSDAPPAGAPQAAVSAPAVDAPPRDDRPMAEAMGVKDEDLPF